MTSPAPLGQRPATTTRCAHAPDRHTNAVAAPPPSTDAPVASDMLWIARGKPRTLPTVGARVIALSKPPLATPSSYDLDAF